MKIILVLITLFAILLYTQDRKVYTAFDLFKFDTTATWDGVPGIAHDSTVFNSTNLYYELCTTAAAETVISRKIPLEKGGNDITVFVSIDSVSSPTDLNPNIYFGDYTGPEQGWKWWLMDSLVFEGDSLTYNVGQQSWGPYRVITEFGIKIEEPDSQRNKYSFRVKHFRWR